jgi:2-dehydropantoate 2-reductase
MKKICIVGAGAIGGFIGTRLANAGEVQVNALARGANLLALQKHGWRMKTASGMINGPATAVSNIATDLGEQDVVIIAVKGPALPEVAQSIQALIGKHTLIVPAMNGVPWWFCKALKGLDRPLLSVDPDADLNDWLPFNQLIGCVVHASTSVSEPGVVQHRMGQGLILGEPTGGQSQRVGELVRLLANAGFDASQSENIRYDIWYKLWGNMTMNPVSALVSATADLILADPLVRDFCSAAMTEAQAIGEKIGCSIAQTPEDRHQITAKLGALKTSMLQDIEAGRMIELDALVGAVREIGQRLQQPTPNLDILFGLTRLMARTRGLYPA